MEGLWRSGASESQRQKDGRSPGNFHGSMSPVSSRRRAGAGQALRRTAAAVQRSERGGVRRAPIGSADFSELSGVIPRARGLRRAPEQSKAHVERSPPSLGLAACGTGRATNSGRAARTGRRGAGGARTRGRPRLWRPRKWRRREGRQ